LLGEKYISILKLAEKYKARKYYSIIYILYEKADIIYEFFQVEPLLLVEKNDGFSKDGHPSLLLHK